MGNRLWPQGYLDVPKFRVHCDDEVRGTENAREAQAARVLTFFSKALRFFPAFQRSYCAC